MTFLLYKNISMTTLFSIAQVSCESGITKEVLRKWEVRYGFPVPIRDGNRNRLYTDEQLSRLKLIRKLINDGYRPSKVVSLAESALISFCSSNSPLTKLSACTNEAPDVLAWVKSRNPALLREKLDKEVAERGLLAFVLEVMPAMNALVGEAWTNGDIAIRDEHVYTEMVQVLIRGELDALPKPPNGPRMLLTTPDGEPHVLGLLMLEVVASLEGAYCISLGAQSPINEIALAAIDFQTDIIALSFSANFPRKKIVPLLKDLRARLPSQIYLWAGGSGTMNISQAPRGISFVRTLDNAVELIRKYRTQERVANSGSINHTVYEGK